MSTVILILSNYIQIFQINNEVIFFFLNMILNQEPSTYFSVDSHIGHMNMYVQIPLSLFSWLEYMDFSLVLTF